MPEQKTETICINELYQNVGAEKNTPHQPRPHFCAHKSVQCYIKFAPGIRPGFAGNRQPTVGDIVACTGGAPFQPSGRLLPWKEGWGLYHMTPSGARPVYIKYHSYNTGRLCRPHPTADCKRSRRQPEPVHNNCI